MLNFFCALIHLHGKALHQDGGRKSALHLHYVDSENTVLRLEVKRGKPILYRCTEIFKKTQPGEGEGTISMQILARTLSGPKVS